MTNILLVVSLDGGSGAGKSTLAAEVASQLGAAVIHCDDFFDATLPDNDWDTYSLEQKCRRCIDWQRMRNEALLPLLEGKKAQYYPYYSLSSDKSLESRLVTIEPSKVIILDGIYSSLLELTGINHLTVLVDVPPTLRRHRHNIREGTDDLDWHLRWNPAEDYYFTALRPPTTFDLIAVNN
ncbi:uridine kinase family protein [Paenibacillus woosongensis]|uniref:Uridine kinase n=1 Tax=Paenibacillus woosongensis TaxID=307580 RepID=A0ABQ4MJN9_9BACL|nr:(d)CMP kinase [Paenibacillus woosongensis]GIP56197.1 uridine kinase [Paenibacillus woosongensis]